MTSVGGGNLTGPVRTKRCAPRATRTRATRTVRPAGRECRWCASAGAPCGSWWPSAIAPVWRHHRRYAWPVSRPPGTPPAVPSPALAGPRTCRTSGRPRRPDVRRSIGSRPTACRRRTPVRSGTIPKGPVAVVPLPALPWKIRPPAAVVAPTTSGEPRPRYRRNVRLPAAVWPRASAQRSAAVRPTAPSIRPSRSRRSRPRTSGRRSVPVVAVRVPTAVAVQAASAGRTRACRAGTRATVSWCVPLPAPRRLRGAARPTWATARLCHRRPVGTRTCWPRIRRRAAYPSRPRNRICLTLRLWPFSSRSWTIRPILRIHTCTIRLRCACTSVQMRTKIKTKYRKTLLKTIVSEPCITFCGPSREGCLPALRSLLLTIMNYE